MKNLKVILLFVICTSIQIVHGNAIENGIDLIFPYANDDDAVQKCESAVDLQRNSFAIFVALAKPEAIPDWIGNELLDSVEDAVISTPIKSRENFIDFLEALFNYKNHLDEIQTDLSLKVIKIVQTIKNDTVMKDLLSKTATIHSDEKNVSKEIFKHCSLIDAAQESTTLFTANINQCINTFRFGIAPEIGKIVNQTVEIVSKPNDVAENATEKENTITNITKLTELIKSQNQISNVKRNGPMNQFSACLENNKNQYISNLSTILTKMNSN